MSTLKVGGIRGTGASADAITVNATDGSATGKFTNVPGKNLIINGQMQIAQRGTSSTTSSDYVADRWMVQWAAVDEAQAMTLTDVVADTPAWNAGFRKAAKIKNGNQTSGAQAASTTLITCALEGQNIAQSGWDYTSASSYVTLSFWVKSSVAQDFPFYIRTRNGSNKRMYSMMTGSLTADTWTKVTKVIPGDTSADFQIDNTNQRAIDLLIAPYYGTDGTASGSTLNAWKAFSSSSRWEDITTTWFTTNDSTFELTGVKLEVGSVATDFDFKTYAEDLSECERYYQVIATDIYDPLCSGAAFAGDMVQGCVHFHKPFRDEPSMVKAGGTNWLIFRYSKYGADANASCDGDDFNLQQVSETMANIRFTGFDFGDNNTMGAGGLLYTQNASASLAFSSELI